MKKILSLLLLAALPCAFLGATETASASKETGPILVKAVQPVYPAEARMRGIEGSMRVDCIVDAQGRILALGTLDEVDPLLKEAALAAIKQWEFAPRADGKTEPFLVRIPFHFALHSGANPDATMHIAAR
jgi:periplasmic protein TonB